MLDRVGAAKIGTILYPVLHMRLEGKSILIVGGTTGMGLTYPERWARGRRTPSSFIRAWAGATVSHRPGCSLAQARYS